MVKTLIDCDLRNLVESRKEELIRIGYTTWLYNEARGFLFDFNKFYNKETNCFNNARAQVNNCSLFKGFYRYIKSKDLQIVDFDTWKQFCADMDIPFNFRIELYDCTRDDTYNYIGTLTKNYISDLYSKDFQIVFHGLSSM